MAADTGIQLRYDGQRYGLWQQVDVHMSVDDLCASVRLSAAGVRNEYTMPVTANTVIDVLADDQLLTTVRPDSLRRSAGPRTHDIHIEARSLGRELVDCQYSQTLSGLRLAEIIKRLCSTFKVPLQINAKTEIVKNFALQAETPANAIINAVRTGNLLLYPLPDGGLVLTEPTNDKPVATIEYGQHIEHYDVVDEYRLRYSDYLVKAYDYSGAGAIHGRSKDDGITFYRPLHIIADRTGYGIGSCERRATLEHVRRLARANRIEFALPGWINPETGKLWALNTQIRLVITPEDIDDVFLIGDLTFSMDDRSGKRTIMQVMRREAFAGKMSKPKSSTTGRKARKAQS